MLNSQAEELRVELLKRCQDYAGIEIRHLGNYRVKVIAVWPDGLTTTILMTLHEDRTPKRWAHEIAAQLHVGYVA